MKLTLQLVVVVLNAQPNFPDTVKPRFNQEPDLTKTAKGLGRFVRYIACVASVSVWFRSKERPRNGILGFGRARNETRAKKMKVRHFSRGL